MKKTILRIVIACMLTSIVRVQAQSFEARIYEHKTLQLPYRILYPDNYDKTKKYPLVIFLHGAGERGNDNQNQLTHGSNLFLNAENRAKYPAIVVFPQCPTDMYWAPIKERSNGFSYVKSSKATEPMLAVMRLVSALQKNEAVDTRRIYVMGLSMGGMGTLDLIARKPKTFAAAISICGGIHTERLNNLTNFPLRLYHGTDDVVVSFQHSQNIYNKLKAKGAKNIELIAYEGINHDSWTNAFAEPDYLEWLFKNKLKH